MALAGLFNKLLAFSLLTNACSLLMPVCLTLSTALLVSMNMRPTLTNTARKNMMQRASRREGQLGAETRVERRIHTKHLRGPPRLDIVPAQSQLHHRHQRTLIRAVLISTRHLLQSGSEQRGLSAKPCKVAEEGLLLVRGESGVGGRGGGESVK